MARFHDFHSDLPPDLLAIVQRLNAANVRYVVIGGMAMVLHGTSHVTVDSDIAVAVDNENDLAIVEALSTLMPVARNYPHGLEMVWDMRSMRGSVISLRTDAGDLDILREVPGVDSFEGLYALSVILVSMMCRSEPSPWEILSRPKRRRIVHKTRVIWQN